MKQKTGIVDVGGGMRGIYAAGVLDFCMDAGIRFDVGVGVSAGSANLASFAAGQARRNRRFFEEYSQRKEYMSWGNWTHTGSFLDLDYIYGTLSNSDGKYPLAAKRLERRAEQYNVGVALARRYAAQGKLLIVAPDDTCGVTTLKRDPACMERLYEKGYRDGRKIVPFLNS